MNESMALEELLDGVRGGGGRVLICAASPGTPYAPMLDPLGSLPDPQRAGPALRSARAAAAPA